MGVTEREYMGDPLRSDSSSFTTWVIIGTLLGIFLIQQRGRFNTHSQFSPPRPTHQTEKVTSQPESTYSRAERLAQIAPIEINNASFEDLMLLPSMQSRVARGIISNRPYSSIEQLDDVYGIGPKTVELYRPYLFIEDSFAICESQEQPAQQ